MQYNNGQQQQQYPKIYRMSEEVKAEIKSHLIKATDKTLVDVVFMCDCTGSMGRYMAKAKDTARQILADVKAAYAEASVFFGFIGYRDHCDDKLIEFLDLTGDVEQVTKFIDKLSPTGGGDEAEAVVDGLEYAAHKVTWREDGDGYINYQLSIILDKAIMHLLLENAMRQLVHILDAPPHGKEFGGRDYHPKGCPCNLDYKKLLKEIKELNVEYMVLNFTKKVDKMVKVYRKYFEEIESVPLVIEKPKIQQQVKAKKRTRPMGGFAKFNVTTQVTKQMAKQISRGVVSNVKKFKKKINH
eukprot:TRINITY_DN2117_c0_g1_i2.p1 TRINITY_DN2117_c0_g1~~TRINITY_DN2117_c0_g1_i2.p1  ORF type:complete len:299 (-),score=23.45 TRINITY_DN2117_c0_g1_i2:97-993(-)